MKTLSLIPRPQNIQMQPGSFTLSADTCLRSDAANHANAQYLCQRLNKATGYSLLVGTDSGAAGLKTYFHLHAACITKHLGCFDIESIWPDVTGKRNPKTATISVTKFFEPFRVPRERIIVEINKPNGEALHHLANLIQNRVRFSNSKMVL